jgi:D-alanine-D-alanine ligase
VRVVVVQGGPSSEAEVSRSSARGVASALREGGHDVRVVELDAQVAAALATAPFDVVFPVVHGAVGEDGALQGLLEVLGAAYVGSDVLASACAMDKSVARRLFAAAGLPVANGLVLRAGEGTAADLAARARREIGKALVVKPAASGSAIGVHRIGSDAPDEAVAHALEAVFALGDAAIVEHFVLGREVTCSVLHLHGEAPRVLAATEIVAPSDAFYTYQARYAPGRSVHVCPADLPDAVTERVHQVALGAHRALGCRDLSRADFVVGDQGALEAVTLLEVNTIPGMTATSLFPEAAGARGITFPALCDMLVRSAQRRGPTRRNAALPLPT